MFNRLSKSLLLVIAFLTLATSANAQGLSNETYRDITREVNQLLLEKDVGEVANQLAGERAPTHVVSLLRRLSIFARAGHRDRVLKTLNQLADAVDIPPVSQRSMLMEPILQSIRDDDLAALRIYYERLVPIYAGSGRFLKLWEKEGDLKEIDDWLAVRAEQNDDWLRSRISWRATHGTAGELLDKLAEVVKTNPTDLQRVKRYILANNEAGNLQNIGWLADVFEPVSAFEAYEVGTWLQNYSAAGAAKLFSRSLSLPFTERDMQLLKEQMMPRFASGPRVLNWEKQLRYWTKNALAVAYRKLNQPIEAQTLVEELVVMKNDADILTDQYSFIKGDVQQASGTRVETTILSEEATRRESASYWTERADYYRGRNEYEKAWETYRLAFANIVSDPLDKSVPSERLSFLYGMVRFWAEAYDGTAKRESRRAEIERILRNEFNAAKPETEYAFGVADIITDGELELNKLHDALFTEQKDLLPRLLSSRAEWSLMEQIMIESVFTIENLSSKEKEAIWTQLEELANDSVSLRANSLAGAMLSSDEARRAIPLLEAYRKSNSQTRDRDTDTNELNMVNALFGAYLELGNWRTAEKFLLANKAVMWRGLSSSLRSVAIVAAESAAIEDSVRLWRKATNLDRRVDIDIVQVARTNARRPLREMYLKMKQRDPLSSAPQAALQLLQ